MLIICGSNGNIIQLFLFKIGVLGFKSYLMDFKEGSMNKKILGALFIILGICSTSIGYSESEYNNNSVMYQIEASIWNEIFVYYDVIEDYCKQLDVDSKLVCAVLYVEKSQYELDAARRLKKDIELALKEIPLFSEGIATWAGLSVGFTHIKYEFAKETKERFKKLYLLNDFELTERDINPSIYINYPETAIKIMVASFKIFQEQWRRHPQGVDITNQPGIIATLYNLGYQKSYPHKEPETGGTFLPIIFQGALLENVSFGDKVGLICNNDSYWKHFYSASFQK